MGFPHRKGTDTMPTVDTIPTEQQMRDNECEVFTYKNFNVWFVAYDEGESFTLGRVDDYDGGDSYPTYDEFLAALTA